MPSILSKVLYYEGSLVGLRGVVWHMVWCGMACGVLCGVVWYGMWCGVVWYMMSHDNS